MRCLSQSEFEQLEARTYVPPDLSTSYFPVALSASDSRLGDISSEDLKRSVKRSKNLLCCESLILDTDKKHNNVLLTHDCLIDSSSKTFQIGKEDVTEDRIVQYSLFPVSNLLFAKDLQTWGIEAEPGYLYFGCSLNDKNTNSSGSYLLDESDSMHPCARRSYRDFSDRYYDPEEGATIFFSDLVDLEDQHNIDRNQSQKREAILNIDTPYWNTIWIGAIADIAITTNSLVMGVINGEDVQSYILKTPFEYPRGFVQETANILQEERILAQKLVDTFCELVFEKNTPKKNNYNSSLEVNGLSEHHPIKGFNKDYPKGDMDAIGPDTWWKSSKNPHLVQTVLLARIIGGNFWQYALGNLETNMQEALED